MGGGGIFGTSEHVEGIGLRVRGFVGWTCPLN
jgi:hypothetical protein